MSNIRRNIMLGTAGHVDHGKTALVKLLTGCETDTLAEEKERGLTIDLGFAPCRLADNRVVGIVDVPGHVDFIRNMVAGAQGIDVVIFVVAADDGIMPQTHEHLQILTLMGLRHGLVALTKIDLVPPERRDGVTAEIHQLLAGTFLAHAPICPISNITGEGFESFFDAMNGVVAACGERPASGVFRMWVEDVFTIRGAGTVVTGIPTRGVVHAEDVLVLQPSGATARVRQMQVYGEDAGEARAGECVALNVPELDHEKVRRGMLLGGSKRVPPVSMAEAELRLLSSLRGSVKDLCEVQLHVGTASVPAQVAMLEAPSMNAGSTQYVQLRWTEPLPLVPGERFVLRANVAAPGQSGVATIGGGRILGLSHVRLRRKKHRTLERLEKRRDGLDDPNRWCELMLEEAAQPLSASQLEECCFLSPAELARILEELRVQGKALQVPGGMWVSSAAVGDVSRRLLDLLRAFHNANPQRAGMPREELFSAAGVPIEVCRLALEALFKSKQVQETGVVVACFGWSARLPEPEQKLADQVAATLRAAGWAAPAPAELAQRLAKPPIQIEKALRLLVDRAVLVRLGDQLFVHRDAVEAACNIALALFAKKPLFSTMEFRDALGVSRKFAVPLLDHLDKIRFTVRSGHDRSPGVEAKKRMPVPK